MAQTVGMTECKTFALNHSLANMVGSLDNVNWSGMAAGAWGGKNGINPAVRCVVESCRYWGSGDVCDASAILVTGDHARECQDTHCATFASG